MYFFVVQKLSTNIQLRTWFKLFQEIEEIDKKLQKNREKEEKRKRKSAGQQASEGKGQAKRCKTTK